MSFFYHLGFFQHVDEGVGIAACLFFRDVVVLCQHSDDVFGVEVVFAQGLPQVDGGGVEVEDVAEVYVGGAVLHDDAFVSDGVEE